MRPFGPSNIERPERKHTIGKLVRAATPRKVHRDAQAVEPLIAMLHDEEQDVRIEAVRALRKAGGSRAMEALTEVLQDDENEVREVRVEAAKALRRSGGASGKRAKAFLAEDANARAWATRMRAETEKKEKASASSVMVSAEREATLPSIPRAEETDTQRKYSALAISERIDYLVRCDRTNPETRERLEKLRYYLTDYHMTESANVEKALRVFGDAGMAARYASISGTVRTDEVGTILRTVFDSWLSI